VGRVVAPSGLAALTVNGIETQPASNGIFKSKVAVPEDGVTVRVVAIDNRGVSDTIEFRLQPGRGDLPPIGAGPRPLMRSIRFGNYYALVIGNNNYEHLPNLRTAHRDARSVSAVLKEKYGFRVTTLLDSNRRETLTAMEELRKKLTPEDNLLIYYAGHGELDELNARGNWLPVDAEPDNAAQWISNLDLTGILNRTTAKHILVIADSCYAATLTRSTLSRLAGGKSDMERAEWIRQMSDKRSVTVLSSGADEPVLDGGTRSGHSVFAKALLDVLRENNDVLDGQSLYLALAAGVAHKASLSGIRQTPQYAPIRYSGHAFGDFFFVPMSPVTSGIEDSRLLAQAGH
jgi:uncharacterized caspase-like protein